MRTARLPLAEHLSKMASTPVLTCTHVVQLVLALSANGGSWAKAIQDVLPARKGAKVAGAGCGKPASAREVEDEDEDMEAGGSDDKGATMHTVEVEAGGAEAVEEVDVEAEEEEEVTVEVEVEVKDIDSDILTASAADLVMRGRDK